MTLDILDDYFSSKNKYSNFWRWSIFSLCIINLLSIFQLVELPNSIKTLLFGLICLFLLGNSFSHKIFKRVGKLECIDNKFIIKLHDKSEYIELTDVKHIKISNIQPNDYMLTFDSGKDVRVEIKSEKLDNFKSFCEKNNIEIIKDSLIRNLKSFFSKEKSY
ncbi:hypothetical protein H8K90_11275 [Winogradskyella echinorum]|uniref:YcxB-like protein n=1 Tax=Winogradskyella echinorum TaxID=538189 RepID=A0ABR6Y3Y6_9FLAO|nr:hypothetical protein [Winogradskyella echinorum]MBC3846963.1 hypothetical protein [Winogradskyella echinorum]MBC5751311.1 hypothetical protein [Winogradskyella echinorum]